MGRWMPLAVVYHKDYQSAKSAFLLYHQFFFVRGIVYFLLMVLPFFEVSDTAPQVQDVLLSRIKDIDQSN